MNKLTERFGAHRPHLRAVAYRMLGSLSEADDAVQEAWLRVSRSDTYGVENLGGWLTTVVARVCLDALQRRQSRREEPLDAGVPPLAVLSDEGGPTRSTNFSWPIRSVSRCSSCWTPSRPPSGSRSSCTTCSTCRSTRSLRSWGAPRRQRGSSRAGHAIGCRQGQRSPTPISPASGRPSTPFWMRPAAVTLTPLLRYSTPTSSSESTDLPRHGAPPERSAGEGGGQGGARLLSACPVRATGARQWRRGAGRGAAGTPLRGARVRVHGRQGRSDRRDRRSSTAPAARPGRPPGLTSTAEPPVSNVSNRAPTRSIPKLAGWPPPARTVTLWPVPATGLLVPATMGMLGAGNWWIPAARPDRPPGQRRGHRSA
jgi:Sigma-70 region 2